MRVMTYNIRHGLGNHPDLPGVFGDLDLDRIAQVIRAYDPDIVGLQEVDRHMQRSSVVDQAAYLADALSMESCYGPNMVNGSEEYGVAVLSRHPIRSSANRPIATPDGWEPRGLLEASIDVPEFGEILALNTHLQYGRPGEEQAAVQQRAEGARLIAERMSDAGRPAILFGDFNAQPGDPELDPLGSSQDAWLAAGAEGEGFAIPACPVREPGKRIDMIYTSRDWRIASCEVVVNPLTRLASDHFPVVAEVQVPRQ